MSTRRRVASSGEPAPCARLARCRNPLRRGGRRTEHRPAERGTEPVDLHGSPGDRSDRQRIAGRGGVRLDGHGARGVLAWSHGDQVLVDADLGTTEPAHHSGREFDIRTRDQLRRQLQVQTTRQIRTDQHQRRDVLAGHISADRGPSGGRRTLDRGRQVAERFARRHADTELGQCLVQRTERTASQRRVTVDRDRLGLPTPPMPSRTSTWCRPARRAGCAGPRSNRCRHRSPRPGRQRVRCRDRVAANSRASPLYRRHRARSSTRSCPRPARRTPTPDWRSTSSRGPTRLRRRGR